MKLRYLYVLAALPLAGLSACGGGSDTSAPAPTSQPATKPAASQATPAKTVDRGAILFKKCQTCHTLGQGEKHKVGPNLFGTIGAPAGQKEGFNYSKALMAANLTWTDENLDAYMERPSKFIPGNQMAFVGIRKPEDRALLIEYLKKKTAP